MTSRTKHFHIYCVTIQINIHVHCHFLFSNVTDLLVLLLFYAQKSIILNTLFSLFLSWVQHVEGKIRELPPSGTANEDQPRSEGKLGGNWPLRAMAARWSQLVHRHLLSIRGMSVNQINSKCFWFFCNNCTSIYKIY